jgi:sugar lactone lactonase YvrE
VTRLAAALVALALAGTVALALAGSVALALAGSGAPAAERWQGSYPEGPVWVDGTLFWAEMGADRVMAWAGGDGSGGAPRVFFAQDGCGPTAVARYAGDEFLVLCHLDGSLVRVDGAGRALATIREDAEGHLLRDPNDASADGAGGVWLTDPGPFAAGAQASGAIYHLAPDGRLTRHATGLAYGNGVHVDGDRLLVSEHLARRVLAYPLAGPRAGGRLGRPEVLFELDALGLARPDYPEAGPDGLEVAPDGTLWVAEYGAGRLLAWAPGRGLVAAVPVSTPYVTSIAFGPGGLAAVTGVSVNDRPPLPGSIWVLPADRLGAGGLSAP